ncbi:MAG: UDP-N-acetylmuramoyl-tripeptide--D-alanyl-D-alanine ligase [Planctomycetota bacterium]|jgi:UDP-N-acetylmuramoyl-tripeptide--D-alanyl-D-alanine ligase|nr:UDP-N-acetylmuramoyl-tripeptide--D-alanyl-D-alanine ligase [Planctomycetota bacterium]
MDLTLAELASWCGGKVDPPQAGALGIHGVSSDSRTIKAGELFIAINGRNQDGHRFIKYAAAVGAPAALAERRPADIGTLPLILVKDVLKALGDIAHGYRWRPPLFPWVAITGSNGKTTARELLSLILGGRWKVRTSKRNWNNFVGLPLSMLDGPADAGAAVMEMGTSGPGEIARLREICVPTVAVVTSTGDTHLSGLGSSQGVAREKADIFGWLPPDGLAVYPGDDPNADILESKIPHRRVSFAASDCPADVRAEDIEISSGGSGFTVEGTRVFLPLLGRHNIGNCLAAMIAARHLGIPFAESAQAVRRAKPVPGRLQPVVAPSGIIILNDSYNANPNSLLAALKVLEELPDERDSSRKIAIVGDMLELGRESRRLHRETGLTAGLMDLDAIFAVGPESAALAEAAQVNVRLMVRHYPSVEALWLDLRKSLAPGDQVLVKGSRGMLMERVVAQLLDWFP